MSSQADELKGITVGKETLDRVPVVEQAPSTFKPFIGANTGLREFTPLPIVV
jgi:hypothetical protein